VSGEKIDLGFFGKTLKEGLLSILEKWRPPSMKTELEYWRGQEIRVCIEIGTPAICEIHSWPR
jgi:hypothetical protein